jgi:hypothetical protein
MLIIMTGAVLALLIVLIAICVAHQLGEQDERMNRILERRRAQYRAQHPADQSIYILDGARRLGGDD